MEFQSLLWGNNSESIKCNVFIFNFGFIVGLIFDCPQKHGENMIRQLVTPVGGNNA